MTHTNIWNHVPSLLTAAPTCAWSACWRPRPRCRTRATTPGVRSPSYAFMVPKDEAVDTEGGDGLRDGPGRRRAGDRDQRGLRLATSIFTEPEQSGPHEEPDGQTITHSIAGHSGGVALHDCKRVPY